MVHKALRDPGIRRAYITTKIVVFGAAALLTWPLSKAIGPRAWWGLGIFGVVLLVMGVAVLAVGRGEDPVLDEPAEEEDEEPPGPEELFFLPIEDRIDLHPFPPKDIPDVVDQYLAAAHEKGYREVRLIHGRGIGVQRERVRSVLSKHPLVVEFRDATSDRGGWGATIASLRGEV